MSTSPAPRTREEIERLKASWAKDPCFDIEDTEGFEAHREELRAYRDEMDILWEQQRDEREARADAAALERAKRAGFMGPDAMTNYAISLEKRLGKLESDFKSLANAVTELRSETSHALGGKIAATDANLPGE